MRKGSKAITIGATALTLTAGVAGVIHKEKGRDLAAAGCTGLVMAAGVVVVKNEARRTGWLQNRSDDDE